MVMVLKQHQFAKAREETKRALRQQKRDDMHSDAQRLKHLQVRRRGLPAAVCLSRAPVHLAAVDQRWQSTHERLRFRADPVLLQRL
jgi:hypothetical protein